MVDDNEIRKDLFFASSNLLKKIRKLEKDHANLLLCDQILYHDWYNLTFRDELQAGELLEKRHKILTTFHVHLKHVAETSKVSLERAYFMLKEEESQYQAGDDVWRFVIDKLRKNRFDAATRSLADGSAISKKVIQEPAVNFAEIFFKDDSALSGLKRKARSVYHYLNEVDDDMMARHLSVPMAGYQLFKETFHIAMKCGDWKLLGRVWKAANPAYQQRFLRNMPLHLKEFLQQIIADNADEVALEKEKSEAENQARTVYRKLVRLLHPDKQVGMSQEHQEWASIKWQRVQAAYRNLDYEALKRIDLLCMAELGQLNDLTTDEIYQSSLVLNEEYSMLKKALKACQKNPAWKFSSRRNFTVLKNRARTELRKKYAPLEAEVTALEKLLRTFAAAESLQ
ncbi:hypothetical protein [Bdellovibrio reynosensis]|uniref:J domain-containing protein n=1 Tax=Bdellovibrio reynosensis TaxID=2835041 RepID=A0ABY4CD57_9BACT|nr:hypothetical protein [Bdellovibrio reynosensis]UOF02902.1 hypothetical protein MNR06_08040 [Bdellovibrio reynosensis]